MYDLKRRRNIRFVQSPWALIIRTHNIFFLASSLPLWPFSHQWKRVHLSKFFDLIRLLHEPCAYSVLSMGSLFHLCASLFFCIHIFSSFHIMIRLRTFSVNWFVSRFISAHESDGWIIWAFMRNLFASICRMRANPYALPRVSLHVWLANVHRTFYISFSSCVRWYFVSVIFVYRLTLQPLFAKRACVHIWCACLAMLHRLQLRKEKKDSC